jgi:hypothetical protein
MNWIVKNKFTIIRTLFLIPILLVAIISISHVISWYDLSNPISWAIYLSIAVEIAAMVSLAAATTKIKGGVWFVFGIVTLIQFIGNIFFSYKEINPNDPQFKEWIELVGPLFENFGTEPNDLIGHKRWLSLLSGGLLPLISLTSLHFFVKYDKRNAIIDKYSEDNESSVEEPLTAYPTAVNDQITDAVTQSNIASESDEENKKIDTKNFWGRIRRLREEGKLSTPTQEDIENEPTALANSEHRTSDHEDRRGFSTRIPDRKTNSVERIGSNKEIRDGNNDTIFFNKK